MLHRSGLCFKPIRLRFKSALLQPRISAKIPTVNFLIAFGWSPYPLEAAPLFEFALHILVAWWGRLVAVLGPAWNHHCVDFPDANVGWSGADALRRQRTFSDQAGTTVLQIAGQSGSG